MPDDPLSVGALLRLGVCSDTNVLARVLNSVAATGDSDSSCSMTIVRSLWLSVASLLSRFRPRICHNSPSLESSTSSFWLILNERQSRRSSSSLRI